MVLNFYAQVHEGICIGVSQLASKVDAPDMLPITSYDTTLIGKRYDQATGRWLDGPGTQPGESTRRVSVLAFRKRYSMAERAAIEWAAVDRAELPQTQRQQAAALRATLADIAAASFIDLDDPDTIAGTQMLESMGLIAAGRAAEILSAPVQEVEKP